MAVTEVEGEADEAERVEAEDETKRRRRRRRWFDEADEAEEGEAESDTGEEEAVFVVNVCIFVPAAYRARAKIEILSSEGRNRLVARDVCQISLRYKTLAKSRFSQRNRNVSRKPKIATIPN